VCEYVGGVHPRHGRFEEVTAIRYDPDRAVVAEEWSQIGEGEQIELVAEYHRLARIRLPNLRLHAGLDGAGTRGQMGRVGAWTPLRLKAHSERSFSGSKSDLPIRGVECTADVAPGWPRNRCAAIFQPCATAVSRRIGDTASATTTKAPVGRQVRRLPFIDGLLQRAAED
jgi:hypothetical protein